MGVWQFVSDLVSVSRQKGKCRWLALSQTKESLWIYGSYEFYLSHMVKDDWFFAVSHFPEHKIVVAGVGKQKLGYIFF